MKYIASAVAILGAISLPAFADVSASTMSCGQFRALDSTGQTQAMADLEAVATEIGHGQELTPGALEAKFTKDCGEHPSMALMDVVTGDKTE